MAYKTIRLMDVWELFRQWHARRKVKDIAESMHLDRKTARKYIQAFQARGLSQDMPLEDKGPIMAILQDIVNSPAYEKPSQDTLKPHLDEIIHLLAGARLKMTSVYDILCQRYG